MARSPSMSNTTPVRKRASPDARKKSWVCVGGRQLGRRVVAQCGLNGAASPVLYFGSLLAAGTCTIGATTGVSRR
jgi:hypothetical protein